MEYIKINGHEITGADLTEIADKLLNGTTTYENLPWMQVFQKDYAQRLQQGGSKEEVLLQLLSEEGHPYHFSFLSSQKFENKELQRLKSTLEE